MATDKEWDKYLAGIVARDCRLVWGGIAPDWGDGNSVSSEEMVEACTDANRLETFGYAEADEAFRLLLADHNYPEVLKLVAKELPFSAWEC